MKQVQQKQIQQHSLKDCIKFYLKCNGWHTYASDKATCDNICSGVNLGILKIDSGGHSMCRIKSKDKALRYLKFGKGD